MNPPGYCERSNRLEAQGTPDPSLSDIPVGFQRDYLQYLSERADTVCSVCKKFLAMKNLQPKYVTEKERQEKAHCRSDHRAGPWCQKNPALWEAALVLKITSGYLAVQGAQGGEKQLILCGCGIADSTMWHLAKKWGWTATTATQDHLRWGGWNKELAALAVTTLL